MITMDLPTAISVTGVMCVVLFNVYEFRKVGREIGGVGVGIDKVSGKIGRIGEEIGKIRKDMHEDHMGLVNILNDMRERMDQDRREAHQEHMEIVNALKSIAG